MKRFFTLFFSLSIVFASLAQVSSGFYRVKNLDSDRYIYVWDNKGKAELEGSQVRTDLDALYLRKDLSNAISDPASVVYVDEVEVDKDGIHYYDFLGQGTSVHKIIGYNVLLTSKTRDGKPPYRVGATVKGVTAYLSDAWKDSSREYGVISTDSKGYQYWEPIPVSSSSENYFGLKPTFECEGKYYANFYASFGFAPVSASTKIYYVSAICDAGAVLLSEISGDVPASTPVIVECASSLPSDNKLDLKLISKPLAGNKLSGAYFDTDKSYKYFANHQHVNQQPVTADVRILTVSSGKLVFAKSSLKTVPANSSYLKVSSSAAENLEVFFSKEEYENFVANGLESVSVEEAVEVYNLLGKKVQNSHNLPAGIYIIGGKKTVIR